MSWDEITNILNQELRPQQKPYDTSTYTKKYFDWKQGYEQIFSRMQGDEYYQELKSQTRILEKEKKSYRRRRLNTIVGLEKKLAMSFCLNSSVTQLRS